jgi:hypothetical protein
MGKAWEGSEYRALYGCEFIQPISADSSDSDTVRVACSVAMKHRLVILAPVAGRKKITTNTLK